ncbi:hypothetical protein CHS0354_027328 [Potamilus streckersoni]|uniref:Uncharacterized protein n=1 Tax=Potamilus streckersoni TaxID=2493646 RepID=A0AAE0VYT4_9BIVA|nr:hypothetical protein CHS0354_027328 [Potamilus streckersoni]
MDGFIFWLAGNGYVAADFSGHGYPHVGAKMYPGRQLHTLLHLGVSISHCVDGFYGNNCSHSCGRCLHSCDKVDGHCPTGCQNGWNGAECLQACDVNYYGNCSERCGHCKDSSVCDKVNGSCASGLCSEGWKGDKCNIECNSTYYGINCAQPCGHCLNNTCDRFTGNCSENGCESGWQGSRFAKNVQQQPVFDTNVVVIGASVGAAVAMAVIIITVVICITIQRRRQMDRSTPLKTPPLTTQGPIIILRI